MATLQASGDSWHVVVEDASGKLRLILDARYTNLFLNYICTYFQTIWDLVRILTRGGFGHMLDFKAGYHHWLLQPDYWTYVGVQWQGVYVHAALPFGVSQAPQAFTQIMQVVYSPLREQLPTAAMIDDAAGGVATLTTACWRLQCHALLLVALGWCLGQKPVVARQQFKFLGFIVDLQRGALLVPAPKLLQFEALLGELQTSWDGQLLARALGKLASFAPTLCMTPLLTRALRAEAQAMADRNPPSAYWCLAGASGTSGTRTCRGCKAENGPRRPRLPSDCQWTRVNTTLAPMCLARHGG